MKIVLIFCKPQTSAVILKDAPFLTERQDYIFCKSQCGIYLNISFLSSLFITKTYPRKLIFFSRLVLHIYMKGERRSIEVILR